MTKLRSIKLVVLLVVITCITYSVFGIFGIKMASADELSPQMLKLQMFNSNRDEITNTIFPRFKLINAGTENIDISEVKIVYFFTVDGEKEQNFWCDWSNIGSSNVKGTFNNLSSPITEADYSLEISFTQSAGNLKPGENIEIHSRVAKEDWTNYTQSNDYSFNPSATDYADWDHVLLFIGDTLISGIDPYPSEPTPESTSEPSTIPETTPEATPEPTLEPAQTPTPTLTPEATMEPTPEVPPTQTQEPTPLITPTPTAIAQSLRLEMYNAKTKETDNTIFLRYRLYNTGDTGIDLKNVKIKYYYTINGEKDQNYWCDWSSAGSANITGTFVKMPVAMIGADYYVETGFTSDAGKLQPGEYVEIHSRIAKSDWTDYIQSDDYSFNTEGNDYTEWSKAAVYSGGELIWGIEPDEPAPIIEPFKSVELEMNNTKTNDETNTIFVKYIMNNTGNVPIGLEDVRIRYYYTIDNEKSQNFWCDWSSADKKNITGKFVKLSEPFDKADYYFETGFTSEAGEIEPGESVEIHLRIAEKDWSDYIQTNDYSFCGSKDYIVWDKASVFIGNELIWGDGVLFGRPDGIAAVSAENSIELSWNNLEGATGYDVEANGDLAGTVTDSVYQHGGLNAGTTYSYRIRGMSSTLTGEWSDYFEWMTLSAAPEFKGSTATEDAISVEWNDSAGATGYDIEVDGSLFESVTSPYVQTGLQPGTEHHYRLRAKNPCGTGNWGYVIKIWTRPGIIEQVYLEALENQISIDWDAVRGAVGYDLEINGIVVENVSSTHVQTGLQPGTEYTLRLRAKNSSGVGQWSEAYTIWTLPDIVCNIIHQAIETEISIRWDAVTGATGYDIEFDDIISDNITGTHAFGGLIPGSQHFYRLRAKNSSGTGKWSERVGVWTLPGKPEITDLFATDTLIVITWADVLGADIYDVEFDGIISESLFSSLTIQELLPGTEHGMRVRAKNSSGEGKWSEMSSYWTLPGITNTISGIPSTTDITVSWSEVTGATYYDIEVDDQLIENQTSPYLHSMLLPGTRHAYRIRAGNSSGVGNWSETFVMWTIPDKVGVLTLQPTETEVLVGWQPVIGATGYDAEIDGAVTEDVQLPFINSGLLPGTQHTYRIRAKNSSGAGEWSEAVLVWTIPGVVEDFDNHASENVISIAWELVEGALTYDIEVDGTLIENIDNPFIHSDLMPGTKYKYRVRACNSSGKGRWSDEICIWTLPGVPEYSIQDPTASSITIQWNAVIGATGYDLEANGEIIEDVASPYIDNGLLPGTEHNYRLRAKNSSGEGKWSISGKKWTIPGQVGSINTVSTQTDIMISWEPVTGAESYDISIDGNVVENISSPYSLDNLNPGTRHIIFVRAENSSGKGEWNEERTVWTLPDKPQNIVTIPASNFIGIMWDETTGATDYEIEILNTPVSTGKNSYNHYGLNPNTQYVYRVRAVNPAGKGEWSEIAACSTLSRIPSPFVSQVSDTSVRLEWEAASGATGYDLELDGVVVYDIKDTFYESSGLTSNSTYACRVRSKNENGISDWSNAIHAATLLTAPCSITASTSLDEVAIGWESVSGATGYDIEVDGTIAYSVEIPAFIHSNLVSDSEHTYRIRAKNENTTGMWGGYIIASTLLKAPENISLSVESDSVQIKWDMMAKASGYDIEADGLIIDNQLNNIYMHSGLLPDTEHKYRFRAKSRGITGAWSKYFTVRTLIGTPESINAIPQGKEIKISWEPVQGATGYDLMVDGVIIDNSVKLEYTHTGLEPNTSHFYRVRARKNDVSGSWSEMLETVTLLGTPANIVPAAVSSKITILWDGVEGSEAYDVEADGVIYENIFTEYFVHEQLPPNTEHKYKVRATAGSNRGEWSDLIIVETTVGIPVNIKAQATTTSVKLTWDAVEGATGYDSEVDGLIKENVVQTTYVHEGLESNSRHTYRIRSRDADSVSEWSNMIVQNTVPEITIPLKKDTTFNFVIVAPAVTGSTERTIVVSYNPDELEVFDLCAVTPEPETSIGQIPGTSISVEEVAPGRIVYKITGTVKMAVNIIKFISKTNGYSKVTYTVK